MIPIAGHPHRGHGTRGAVLALLGVWCLAGCEPQRAAQARPWMPYAPQPYYATRGPDPYTLPGGSEARDPWSSRSSAAGAPTAGPQPPTPSATQADGGVFLIVTNLEGPSALEREPAVNALLARLGGVRRAPTLWEVAPQPGGGLGSVAAALEKELCAEDIAVIYRARGHAMERSEFAGHKVCAPPLAPVGAPAAPAKKPGGDPLRTRF